MRLIGIKSKLLLMLLGVSLGSIASIAYLAFRSGNHALTESVLADGLARVSLRTKAGEEREVMELSPGEAFGEGALLKGERSPVTVTAVSDLTVVALDTTALEAALEADPGLATELGQLVEVRRRAVQRVKHADGEPESQ